MKITILPFDLISMYMSWATVINQSYNDTSVMNCWLFIGYYDLFFHSSVSRAIFVLYILKTPNFVSLLSHPLRLATARE